MGFGNRLKSFDVYRKLPQDLTQPTLSGALVSIISTLIMITLFLTEFSAFLEVNETSEMFVDYSRSEQKLQVNLDLVFYNLPCDIVSLDAQDVMGSHHVNLVGDLKKIRIDKNEKVIEEINAISKKGDDHSGHSHDQSSSLDLERAKKAFKDREGCQLKGYIFVNKVPGNFHISSHAYGNKISQIFQQSGIKTLDLSHKLNHLSFGKMAEINQIQKKFTKGVLNPLDGTQKTKPEKMKNQGIMYQYYISIVPSIFEDLRGKIYNVFQFTSNNNELHTQHLPAVYFRYDLSPVTVRFKLVRESFFHFLVQICAIIGGVFTVAGIIDGMVHKSVKAIFKKAEINKLS
ncbi:hypothetical protein PPERSA_01667 [Pseudocohnilembus persalinus]|uniref:Endoplasmic reticulum vesicle transporter, C-terminal n=1 Tax=Pseudocohnilembus persalinus TaxID=266149 RepID=A0A0V0R1E1_PSEPJ|nr:hypothetical protein PPERSA_01667 [Pseudocohnilembus persalinus]|eukprot:KRX08122.1 hypothetical protein PPERSA_01667 [Pseudocohnilembus persalinus]